MMQNKPLIVWTNGTAIRKYTGQDKNKDIIHHAPDKGWFKAEAHLIKIEEDN